MPRFTHLTFGLLGVISLSVQAHDHSHDTHSPNAAAHHHGVGHLDLVLDGNELVIELLVPAEDLLGFEQAPRTPGQRAQLAKLHDQLQQPDTLFALPPAARCSLTSAELNSSLFAQDAPATGDVHHEHADIRARYHFSCAATRQLKQLDVILFEQFPGSHRLLLQSITPRGQYGGELNAASNRIHL